jgi:hypothetical protein
MKTLVFQTDALQTNALRPVELVTKRVHWFKNFGLYDNRLEAGASFVIVRPTPRLADMLVEIEDGVTEADAREAIQAAALADDWQLGSEIAARYGWVVCLRCADDVQHRPTWRLYRFGIKGNWGEICGSCAVTMIRERQ